MNDTQREDIRSMLGKVLDAAPAPTFPRQSGPDRTAGAGQRYVLGVAAVLVVVTVVALAIVLPRSEERLTLNEVPSPPTGSAEPATPALSGAPSLPTATSDPPASTDGTCGDDPGVVLTDLLATRLSGPLPLNCIDSSIRSRLAEPAASLPCWTVCADGSTVVDFEIVRRSEFEQPSTNERGSSFEVVVSYANDDDAEVVVERLHLTVDENGNATLTNWTEVDVAIDIAEALQVVTDYVDALDRADFARAAEILGGGQAELTERVDLDPLQLEGNTNADLERALEMWCESAVCSGGVVVSASPSSSVSIDVAVDLGGQLTTLRVATSEGALHVLGVPAENR